MGNLTSPIVNIALDELARAAIDGGIASRRFEVVAESVISMSSIVARSRMLSKARQVCTVPCHQLSSHESTVSLDLKQVTFTACQNTPRTSSLERSRCLPTTGLVFRLSSKTCTR